MEPRLKAIAMNEWMSVKKLQALRGRLNFMHYDECKLYIHHIYTESQFTL